MDFALYLYRNGVVTAEQFVQALCWQQESRSPIGRLAIERRKMSVRQVLDVLHEQADSAEPFGRLAIRLGYLTEADVAELLKLQSDAVPKLDEVFIEMGLCSATDIAAQRQAYFDWTRRYVAAGAGESPLAATANR